MNANADLRERLGEGGFTLIEVLIAMVILAVGLLGLEALGISAARANVFAQRQSEYALAATQRLEAAVDSVQRNAITCGTVSWPGEHAGETIQRTVQSASNRRVITVRVFPAASGPMVRPDTFQLVTNVFVPNATSC